MFKTILLHVDGGAHQESRLRAAVLPAGAIPAQRASRAARPPLRAANRVCLAVVDPDEQPGLHGDEPGADMAPHLARHGVPVEVAALHIRAPESGALMDMAHDCRAGLLVAGVFGHGYRGWGLGGVTRDRFGHAPAPLLTMH